MSEVKKALVVIRQAMIDDGPSELGSLAHGWHCNIAMMCCDAIDDAKLELKHEMESIDGHAVGNDAASRFMKLCFDVETTNKAEQVKTMTELEELEKKVADTKAAADEAAAAYVTAYADEAAAAYGAYVTAKAAHVKARDELQEYIKEQDKNG